MKRKKKSNNDLLDNTFSAIRPVKLTADMKKAGSIKGKIPVWINSSTVVYVKPGTDIEYVKHKYERICR